MSSAELQRLMRQSRREFAMINSPSEVAAHLLDGIDEREKYRREFRLAFIQGFHGVPLRRESDR
jgi:hypothetical protein